MDEGTACLGHIPLHDHCEHIVKWVIAAKSGSSAGQRQTCRMLRSCCSSCCRKRAAQVVQAACICSRLATGFVCSVSCCMARLCWISNCHLHITPVFSRSGYKLDMYHHLAHSAAACHVCAEFPIAIRKGHACVWWLKKTVTGLPHQLDIFSFCTPYPEWCCLQSIRICKHVVCIVAVLWQA